MKLIPLPKWTAESGHPVPSQQAWYKLIARRSPLAMACVHKIGGIYYVDLEKFEVALERQTTLRALDTRTKPGRPRQPAGRAPVARVGGDA